MEGKEHISSTNSHQEDREADKLCLSETDIHGSHVEEKVSVDSENIPSTKSKSDTTCERSDIENKDTSKILHKTDCNSDTLCKASNTENKDTSEILHESDCNSDTACKASNTENEENSNNLCKSDNANPDDDSDVCDSSSNDEYESADEGEIEMEEEQMKLDEESLSEEEKAIKKEQAQKYKEEGNRVFKEKFYKDAVKYYSRAIQNCPYSYFKERSIMYSNRAACKLHMEKYDDAIKDSTKAIELNPHYLKAILRRAELYEKVEKLEEALSDYQKVVELDSSHLTARQACMRLPDQIKEKNEKLKEEMMGKLKDLGNMILKPFGLSTNNFKLNQDPKTGGYSVNFQQNPES